MERLLDSVNGKTTSELSTKTRRSKDLTDTHVQAIMENFHSVTRPNYIGRPEYSPHDCHPRWAERF